MMSIFFHIILLLIQISIGFYLGYKLHKQAKEIKHLKDNEKKVLDILRIHNQRIKNIK